MVRTILLAAACAQAQPALAQAIFKCTEHGKTEYRDRPCADGVQLQAPPAPAVAPAPPRGDREMLLEMEKLRLTQELRAERQRTTAAREARAQAREQRAEDAQRKRCAKLRLKQKWSSEDRARLTGAAASGAERKARRDAETLAVECPA
ncbi:hypothetical protein GCM10027321_00940 [Massilia terrae]|uniref:DUF4124 domain-containing protein n=1 Tax=Massilia terrae TaxID=1811224 RepID=A0ABT2CU87_9BURK|nr:DUF4124 domain-containing protein [Massilia terrae]MCS0657542.1 DUF4124 domain-containing protein [Massilia terrae]